MKINIVVNKGNYDNVITAAHSENSINWWDESDSRSTICTECFAAAELSKYLEH